MTGSATASYTDFYYDNYESYNTYFRCYYSNGYLHVNWYGDWTYDGGSECTDYSGILSLTTKGGAIVNYTVTFDPNGGYRTSGGDLVQTIPSGHSATPPHLMRAGHTYIWRGSYTNITSNRTITAIWTPTKRFVSKRTQKELPFGCSSGSGSVNTNSGRFSFVHKDVTVGAGSFLLGVAHMYNSHFAHDARTSNINTYLGAGWKLDIHQYVKEVGDDLHYIDAAGNVNVFVRVSVHNVDGTAMEYTYRDVLGSGTRIYIQKNIPTPLYRLVDEVGNQMTFDVNGRLTEIESAINSSINKTIVYDSLGRPTALYDSRKTDRIIHFIYAQDNLLNYITTTLGNSEKHRITCIYDSAGRLVQLDETLQNVTGALNKVSKTLTKFTYDIFGNMQCIYNAEDKSGLYLSSSIELWTMSLQSGAVTNTDNPTSGFATKSKVGFSAVGDYYTAVTNDKGVTMNYELDDDGNCVSVYETSGNMVSSVMPSPEGKRFFDTTTDSNCVNSTKRHVITQSVGYTQANGMNHYALTSLSSTEKKNINDYLADNKTKYVMFGAWVFVKQNSFSSSEKASVFVRLSNGLELKESYYYIPINQAKVGRWQYVTATTKIKDHLFAEENCQVGIAKSDNGIGFDVNIADLRMMALPGGTFFRQNSTNLYDLTSIVVNDSITIDLTQTGTRLGDNFITEEDIESMLYSRFNDTAFFTFFYNNKTKFVGRVSTLKFVAGNWSYTVNSLTGVATVDEPIVYSETTIGSTQVKKHRVYSSGQYTDYIKYKLVFTNITDTKTYKRDGRLLETIDEYGVVTHYHYDVNGNLLTKLAVSSDSKLKMIQIFTYNGNDEMTSYTDGFGITHTLATNANSQPFSLTKSVTNNAGGDTTSFEYDQWLRKTSISEAGGGAVGTNSFIYDSANKLSAVSDGGALYGVQYNAFGDISSISEGGNTLFNRTYTYGPNNTVSTVFGNEPSYSYDQTFDKYGRLTSIGKTNASANVEQITEWQYKDPHSSLASSSARLSKILDNSSDRETSYSYDINGNYSEYQVKDGGNALYGMWSIPIDSLRNKSYGLNIGLTEYFYGITYDGNILINPRVESVFDDSTGVTTTPEYDSMGRLYRLKRVDSNYAKAFYIEEYSYKDSLLGSAYTTSVIHKLFTYNDVDYIKELTHDITYDASGNVTGINNADSYTYDRLGRMLTESSNGVVTSYAYDTRGNIKTKTVACNRTTFSYSEGDNKLTEIANIGTEAIAKYIRCDACGYPVKYKVSDAVVADNMTWLRGNLTQYRGNGADSNYRYDVNGIRTHKQCGTKSSTMINDCGKLMAEIRSDIGQVYYAYDTLGLSGIRFKDSDSSSNPYGRFMVRQDCLGNISEIYLIGNGSRTKVAKYSYTALGECKLTAYAYTNGLSEVIAIDDVRHVANVNPFRWKGYYYDAETDLPRVSTEKTNMNQRIRLQTNNNLKIKYVYYHKP